VRKSNGLSRYSNCGRDDFRRGNCRRGNFVNATCTASNADFLFILIV